MGVEPIGDRKTCHPPVLKTGTITGPHALPCFLSIATGTGHRRCAKVRWITTNEAAPSLRFLQGWGARSYPLDAFGEAIAVRREK
jgi:hypothetical protein